MVHGPDSLREKSGTRLEATVIYSINRWVVGLGGGCGAQNDKLVCAHTLSGGALRSAASVCVYLRDAYTMLTLT